RSVEHVVDEMHRADGALEIARIGKQVEGDERLPPEIRALQPHQPAREGLVGAELDGAELEAHLGPGETVRYRKLHVLRRAIEIARAEAHAEKEIVAQARGQPPSRLDVKADADQRMLLQIRADARTVRDHGDAVLPEVLFRPDARAHEDRRRVERAAGDDDLAALDPLTRAVAQNLDGDRALPLQRRPLDQPG